MTSDNNSPAASSIRFKHKLRLALLVAFAIFLIRLAVWIANSFGDISFDQLLFHIGPNSTSGVPKILIHHGVLELVYKPLAGFILIFSLFSIRFLQKPILLKTVQWLILCVICFGFYLLYDVLKINEYIDRSKFLGDWYQTHAQTATTNFVKPEHARNLIFIYVESLEKYRVSNKTYLGKLSEQNGIPKQWYMMPGTQWTLAAMISSQCGIPQMLHGFSGKNNLNETPHPLSKAICMGDILRAAGYQTVSIDSANPQFAGNGNFLGTHGFSPVEGAPDIDKKFPGSQIANWWGVADSSLFKYAKERITQLASGDRPFYISMNTMNTHGPHGILSETCKAKGYEYKMNSLFDCSVEEVGEFIQWIKTQDFANNTVIVVMGDHQLMAGNLFKNWFVEQKEPEIFFMIDRPDQQKLPNKIMTHFDIFPSTLSALGFEIPNQHLGLGYNIYTAQSLSEQMDYNELRRRLRKSSAAYDALW